MNTFFETEMNNDKRTWKPMSISYVGNVAEIVRGGGGKLTPPFDDPGEPRKPKGQE